MINLKWGLINDLRDNNFTMSKTVRSEKGVVTKRTLGFEAPACESNENKR